MINTVNFVYEYITKNALQCFCLSIIILLNVIFFYKYSIRINAHSLLFSLCYGMFLFILYFTLNKFSKVISFKKYSYWLFFVLIGIQLILLYKIPVESLNTDRWSVITSFLNELFTGNFPYLAKSHLDNPPGPFPGYYLFALPFYLIGEIGLYSTTGIVLFLLFLKFQNIDNKSIFSILIIMFSSIFIWYELVVRSTIFVNMAITLVYFYLLERKNSESFKNLALLGILGGLILSTRGIVIYVLIVYFTHLFIKQKDWYRLFIVSIFTVIGFLLTLLPFAIWDWNLFMIYNPITLQASFIPKIYLILFTILALLIGYFSKNTQMLIGFIGLLLFTIVSVPFFIRVLNSNIYNAIVENGFDISYFLFSTPFLVYALFSNEIQMRLKNE